MKTNRKAFNFYQSHWEQIKLLNDSQKLDLFNAICEVQFLETNLDDISFKDPISNLVWTGIKHSINTSLTGFINKNKALDKGVSMPLAKGGKDTPKISPLPQVQEKEEEEEEEQLVGKPFSFSLSTTKQLSNTSKEYQDNLKAYIEENDRGMSYEDFFNSCEMKGYKYKNYKLAYGKWTKESNQQTNKSASHNIKGAEGYTVS